MKNIFILSDCLLTNKNLYLNKFFNFIYLDIFLNFEKIYNKKHLLNCSKNTNSFDNIYYILSFLKNLKLINCYYNENLFKRLIFRFLEDNLFYYKKNYDYNLINKNIMISILMGNIRIKNNNLENVFQQYILNISNFKIFFVKNYLDFDIFLSSNFFEIFYFIEKSNSNLYNLFHIKSIYFNNVNDHISFKFFNFTTTNISNINILDEIETDYLRFYFACKIKNDNNNFNINECVNKINSNLIGKFLNIFLRCSKILIRNYNCLSSDKINEKDLFFEYLNFKDIIKKLYDRHKFNKIIYYVMKLADKINIYINNEKPWYLLKDKITFEKGREVCTMCLNLFLILLVFIKPIIPKISKTIENILNLDNLSLENFKKPILNIKIKNYKIIAKKLYKKTTINI